MLKTTIQDNYMIVQLDRGRANPMNSAMVNQLTTLFRELEQREDIQGVVLTGKERFFSAGLDLIELYDYNEAEILQFWMDFFEMVKTLATFPKPLVAGITGHSPAGGCVLAICCDYRVMAEGKYRIGLNEVPVGIAIPKYIFGLYSFWVGRGNAHRFLLEGKLLTVEEALAAQLVDEICPAEDVLPRAIGKLKQYLAFDPHAWKQSKSQIRQEIAASFEFDLEKDMGRRMEQWWRPTTRAIMGGMIERLTAKK